MNCELCETTLIFEGLELMVTGPHGTIRAPSRDKDNNVRGVGLGHSH